MNKLKKALALVLTVMMVFALTAPAYAGAPAPQGSITIVNSLPGRSYSIYKIFDATVSADGTGISYTYSGTLPDNDYFEQDDTTGVITATGAADDGSGNLTAGAIAFLATLKPSSPTASSTATNTTLIFSGIDLGYYYVEASGETVVTVDSTKPNVKVIDKNDVPSWDNEGGDPDGSDPAPGKVIVNADSTTCIKNSVDYGDRVDFNISVNAYSYVVNSAKEAELVTYYYITDTLAAGFVNPTTPVVKIYKVGSDGAYLSTPITLSDSEAWINQTGNTFEITVPFGEKYGTKAKIEVTYSATINADGTDVVLAGDGNLNTANFTYSKTGFDPDNPRFDPTDPDGYDPDDPNSYPGPVTPSYDDGNKKTTTTYVYALGLQKIDETAAKLKGASFSVADSAGTTLTFTQESAGVYRYNPNDTVTELKTDDNGLLTVKGLAAGAWTLTEVTAPEGYNKLKNPLTLTAVIETDYAKVYYYDANGQISATMVNENMISTFTEPVVFTVVKNLKGAELPSTGGIGTTIFYITGSVLLLAAAVLLITRKRMKDIAE